MRSSKRIVVIRPGALGDTLLTLPSLALLRERLPSSHLTFVGRRDALPLVAATGLADDTLPFDLPGWSALFDDESSMRGLAAETLRGCDVAIAWLTDPDGAVARNLRILSVRQIIVAPGNPSRNDVEHAAFYLARTLAPLGIMPPASHDIIHALLTLAKLRSALLVEVAPLNAELHACVAVHPGSGGAAKRWPPERFAAIVARLAAAGYQPLLIQGPQDEPVTRHVLGALAPGVEWPTLTNDLTLMQLAALLVHCVGYIGNDSGVSHLAGLLGVPTSALFGPTDPVIWSPLGTHVRTLRAASRTLDGLDVETVWAALIDLLAPGT